MKIYTQRLDHSHQSNLPELALTYNIRQKSRFRAKLTTGETIGVDLPRTGILHSGTIIATTEGEALRIVAAPQSLMQVTTKTENKTVNFDLMRCAYHLGNRHVPLMLTPEALYFEPDHVLQDMLIGLGAVVTEVAHPFEPESGAYAGNGHSHGHSRSHSHSHHNHSHLHDHDHKHNPLQQPDDCHPQDLITANFQFMG